MLLPLTESLYVSGTLESVGSVLLEVGTGYFVEVFGEGKGGVCAHRGPATGQLPSCMQGHGSSACAQLGMLCMAL